MKMRARSMLSALAGLALVVGGCWMAAKGPAEEPAVDRNEPLPIEAARLFAASRALVEAGPAAQGLPSKPRVRALIVERLQATGARVQELPFTVQTPAGPWDLTNVIASFHPEAKSRVMLGTHWDTRPWAERDPDPSRRGEPITGANDGVSGVSVLLEIARELDVRPPPAGVGVDLVFFDGEEGFDGDMDEWFYGSTELAERWFTTGVTPPRAGVIVDMVARRGLAIHKEGTSREAAPHVLDRLFAIAKAKGHASFVDAPGIYVLDDQIPFHKRGIPVALLIDLHDPVWHTHEDTLEKIDPNAMAEVADVVLAWVREQRP